MDSAMLGAGLVTHGAKQSEAEPRISSSSAAGEMPGGGFPVWPQHALDGAGGMAAMGREHGGESMYGMDGAGAGFGHPGSPALGAGGGMFGAGPGIPQFGMIPVDASAQSMQQASRDASAGGGAANAPPGCGGGGGGAQLSGASSLGAPSPLHGASGDDGGSSSGSMPPPPGRAAAAAAAHHHAQQQAHEAGPSGAAAAAAAATAPQVFRSEYRGVSYDKKKRKWRVQIKVAALGKSGVSVGYFDTEIAAARAYDRAAIGLLGRQNCRTILNFPIEEYDNDSVPELVGKTREEVKATLKSERAKLPRRRLTNRRRTSKYLGVGSSNRKNQWQARILYHGKVTHLGYYRTEEEAARVYDKVSISLHGDNAQTNFPIDQYAKEVPALQQRLSGLSREELQRALGVKPMDRSSKYRGVNKKKGRWEAKVILNRRWAYRELFDSEEDAARAYDGAMWRLRPRDARGYVNFKDSCPQDVADALRRANKDHQAIALHPSGLPLTAKPLIDAGLLYDDEGASIKTSKHRMARIVSTGDLATIGDINAATTSSGDPSGAHDHSNTTGGGTPTAVGGSGSGAVAGGGGGGATGPKSMAKSASFSALSALDQQPAAAAAAPAAAAAAAAAVGAVPVPLGAFTMGGIPGGLPTPMGGVSIGDSGASHMGGFAGGGMPRVQSTPSLHAYQHQHHMFHAGATQPLHHLADVGSPQMHHGGDAPSAYGGLQLHHHPIGAGAGAMAAGMMPVPGLSGAVPNMPPVKLEGTFWSAELPQGGGGLGGMNRSQSCGNLALGSGMGGDLSQLAQLPHMQQHQTVATAAMLQQQQQQQHQQQQHPTSSDGSPLLQPFGSQPGAGAGPPLVPQAADPGPQALLVRVGSEQHLIASQPTQLSIKGLSRIASEGHIAGMGHAGGGLASMVPVSPRGTLGGGLSAVELMQAPGGEPLEHHHAQHRTMLLQQQHMQQQAALYQHHQQQQLGLLQQQQHQQQQMAQRQGHAMLMHRSHSVAVMGGLESIDELQATASFPAMMGKPGVAMSMGGSGMVPVGPPGGSQPMMMGAGMAAAPAPGPGSLPGGVAVPLGGLHGGYSHAPLAAGPLHLQQQLAAPQAPLSPPGPGAAAGGAAAVQGAGSAAAGLTLKPGGGGSGGGGWEAAGTPGLGLEEDHPDSPFALNGSVQIGGEELDMALAFLSDGPGGDLDSSGGGGGGAGGALAPSPGHGDLGGSGLLLADGAVRMDETAG